MGQAEALQKDSNVNIAIGSETTLLHLILIQKGAGSPWWGQWSIFSCPWDLLDHAGIPGLEV